MYWRIFSASALKMAAAGVTVRMVSAVGEVFSMYFVSDLCADPSERKDLGLRIEPLEDVLERFVGPSML